MCKEQNKTVIANLKVVNVIIFFHCWWLRVLQTTYIHPPPNSFTLHKVLSTESWHFGAETKTVAHSCVLYQKSGCEGKWRKMWYGRDALFTLENAKWCGLTNTEGAVLCLVDGWRRGEELLALSRAQYFVVAQVPVMPLSRGTLGEFHSRILAVDPENLGIFPSTPPFQLLCRK